MVVIVWFIVIGLIMISMALSSSVLKRLPLTTSLLYLIIGVVLGPQVLDLLDLRPLDETALMERLTEVAVIVSLFTAGLKLRVPWRNPLWRLPVILAFVSMALTVGLIALAGATLLGLSVGAAVLLGAVLAPTDPVLASDVQVADSRDRDRLRFTLTAEAGLNDGSAFPLVMLGLGLVGMHELGAGGSRWLAVDVLWSIPVGLGVGALLGTVIGRLVIYLRREYQSAVGLDDFLTLGLIALSYGVALLVHSYGFLAVFAAGLAVRRIEQQSGAEDSGEEKVERAALQEDIEELATDPATAPAYLTQALLGFNEQLERIGEVTVMLMVGSLLSIDGLSFNVLWFMPLLFLVIRPVASWIGTLGSDLTWVQRGFIAWFGIRGIGSIYYLTYAIEHGVPEPIATQFLNLVLMVVAVSVVVHGISVTPLMERYKRSKEANGNSGVQLAASGSESHAGR